MWIWVIIIAIIIGAIWGALTSKDGEKSEGAFAGAVTGGMGCGYVLRFFVKFGGTSSIVNKESWLSVVCFLPYCTSAFLPL